NQTALDYFYEAVDAAIKFIEESDVPQGFTLAPINEPVDNRDITKFGTPEDGFRPVGFWAKYFAISTNLVFDVHNYYFTGRPTTSDNLPEFICADAEDIAGTTSP
ncbi:hypothetical protein FGRMN_11172, partial [Fusarium graminum]